MPEEGWAAGRRAGCVFALLPWVAQTSCSVSASHQYCLPVLLVVIHYKFLTFGKGLDVFAESCSGQKKDE